MTEPQFPKLRSAERAPLDVVRPAKTLGAFDLRLLGALARVVPEQEREDWRRGWDAELWHIRFGQRGRILACQTPGRSASRYAAAADLVIGIALDALWLRRESWRRVYGGTAGLCVVSLALLCCVAALVGANLAGDDLQSRVALRTLLLHSVFATPLLLFVACATEWRYTESAVARGTLASIRGSAFLGAKTMLVLLLAALLSTDICLPFHGPYRGRSDVLQQLFFVLLALVGLRWAFGDQRDRCKDCLRCLALPERVGRPSHNLLEWAGTEQVCIDGHGALSSPEMVSSWCEHSRWSAASARPVAS